MSKKLNSFILPDNIIQKMKNKIEEARIKDVEVGFNLCTEDSKLHDEFHCTGSKCQITFPEKCIKGRKIGIFHTHLESLEPSMTDIYHAYEFGINCIGNIEQKKIRCHVRKDKIVREKNIQTIAYQITRFEEPLFTFESTEREIEKYQRYIRARNDLKKRYLDTIDIV